MTSTTYKVLGLPMQRQSARRKLVVAVYAVLAAFCTASIFFAQTEPLLYSWTIYATMAAACSGTA
jgi:branched-subunit amino acid transport protein